MPIEITLKIDSDAKAAGVLAALAAALSPGPPEPRRALPVAEPENGATESENGTTEAAERSAEEDAVVRAAVKARTVIRTTGQMDEVVRAIVAAGGEVDRGTLSAVLPERTNNSIGRSLGALQRAGVAEPRFEGSSHWKLTPLGRAAVDGRIAVRVDKRERVEERTEA